MYALIVNIHFCTLTTFFPHTNCLKLLFISVFFFCIFAGIEITIGIEKADADVDHVHDHVHVQRVDLIADPELLLALGQKGVKMINNLLYYIATLHNGI